MMLRTRTKVKLLGHYQILSCNRSPSMFTEDSNSSFVVRPQTVTLAWVLVSVCPFLHNVSRFEFNALWVEKQSRAWRMTDVIVNFYVGRIIIAPREMRALDEDVCAWIINGTQWCHGLMNRPESWRESLYICTFFLFPDSGLNLFNGSDFLFWYILNGVTLKTSNKNLDSRAQFFKNLDTRQSKIHE